MHCLHWFDLVGAAAAETPTQMSLKHLTLFLQGKRVYYQTVIIESDVTLDGIQVPQRETLHVKCSISSTRLGNHTLTRRDVLPAGFQEAE